MKDNDFATSFLVWKYKQQQQRQQHQRQQQQHQKTENEPENVSDPLKEKTNLSSKFKIQSTQSTQPKPTGASLSKSVNLSNKLYVNTSRMVVNCM